MIYDQFPHSRMAIQWITPDYHHLRQSWIHHQHHSSTTLGSCMTHHWFFGLVPLLEQTYLSWTLYLSPYSDSRSARSVWLGGEKTGSSGKLLVSNKQLVRLGQQFIEYRVSRFYKFSCHHSTSFNVPSHISLWTHGAKNCKVEIQTRTQQRPGNPCREAVTALSPIIMPLTLSIACPEPECSGMVELACQVQLAPAVLHPRIRNAQIHSRGTSQNATNKLMPGLRESFSLSATLHMIVIYCHDSSLYFAPGRMKAVAWHCM